MAAKTTGSFSMSQPGSIRVSMTDERRARAFRAARRHSVMVRILKVLLPIAAIGCLGLYVMPGQMSFSIGDATASVDDLAIESGTLKMVNPRLSGVHQTFGRYEIRADAAIQNVKTPDRVALQTISGDMVSPSGDTTQLSAPGGVFQTRERILSLDQGLTIRGRGGLFVSLKSARANIADQLITSDEPVVMRFGDSEIQAQTFKLHTGEARAVFTGQVRVRLERGRQTSEAK
jgi:lipopolysaccharide export system protein LptC